MENLGAILSSSAALAWPLIAAVVLYKIFPVIREIITSRSFSLKVGEMEVTVQEATDQLRLQVDDLQEKVAELRKNRDSTRPSRTHGADTEADAPQGSTNRTILWVDDFPTNNAYEVAKLTEEGFEILQLKSTDEAMRLLSSGNRMPSLILSDMGRKEALGNNPRAGLDLLERMRSEGIDIPFAVYASPRAVKRYSQEVAQLGGIGVTASPVELFEFVDHAIESSGS